MFDLRFVPERGNRSDGLSFQMNRNLIKDQLKSVNADIPVLKRFFVSITCFSRLFGRISFTS